MQLRICLAIDRLDLQEALKAESTMFLHDQLNLSYHPCCSSMTMDSLLSVLHKSLAVP